MGDNKKILWQILLGTGLILGASGGFGPLILKGVGWVDSATTLYELFTVVRGVDLNWSTIYVFCFTASFCGLVVLNTTTFSRWWRIRKMSKPIPDTAIDLAVEYIRYLSTLSHDGLSHDEALEAFRRAAASGKIKTWGVEDKNSHQVPIRRFYWRRGKLELLNKYTVLISNRRSKEVIVSRIVVDNNQVRHVWPRIRGRSSNTGY